MPIDEQNQFVEIESIELEEIWFNSGDGGSSSKTGFNQTSIPIVF